MQNDFQCYRRAIASRLVEQAKDETVTKSTSLLLSVGTVSEFLSDAHFLDLVSERKSMHSYCACALRRSIMGEP